jgi:hypothetical protein
VNLNATVQLLNNTLHGYLGTGSNYHDAGGIYVPGSYWSANTVGAALDDIGSVIGFSGGAVAGSEIEKYVGFDFESNGADYQNISIIVPADAATSAIIVQYGAKISVNGANPGDNASRFLPLKNNATDLST